MEAEDGGQAARPEGAAEARDGRGGARPGAGRKKGQKNAIPARGRREIRQMISLPPEAWEKVGEIAEKRGIRRTHVLRDAVLHFLKYFA